MLYRYKSTSREGLILHYQGGLGEIAPLPGWSKESLEEAEREIFAFLKTGTLPKLPSVRFALFCTKTPFDGSPLKIPLCSLHTPSSKYVKLKIGHLSLLEAVSHTQKHLGKYRIRVDINRKWSLQTALEFTSFFSKKDFDYIEEPVSAIEDLAVFIEKSQFPVAVDESLREHKILPPRITAAVVKPTLMGEIPLLPYRTVLSSSYESSLGILQIARHANKEEVHGLDTFIKDILIPPLYVKEGNLCWDGNTAFPLDTSKLCKIL